MDTIAIVLLGLLVAPFILVALLWAWDVVIAVLGLLLGSDSLFRYLSAKSTLAYTKNCAARLFRARNGGQPNG